MSANFTPSLNVYTDLTPFRFWCQKVLPLAYDDSLSYYELLCKVVDYLNKTMEDVSLSIEDVEKLHAAYVSLQGYVNNYFNNLDVQEEINNKLDALVADGTIHEIFTPDVNAILNVARQASLDAIAAIPSEVTDWLDDNISQETGYVIDNTLSVSGAAADAKVTGEKIGELKSEIDYIGETYRYTDFVQGAIDNATGDDVTNNNFCRSGFISLDEIDTIYKPIGVQQTIYYYSQNNVESYIENASGSNITEAVYTSADMRAAHPAANFIRVRARCYNGSTALTTTPEMLLATSYNINIVKTIREIATEVSTEISGEFVNKGFFELQNVTLTEDTTYRIPYSVDKYNNMMINIRCKYTGDQPVMYFARKWLGPDGYLHEYYNSARFPIGGTEYKENTFRTPKYFVTSDDLEIRFVIPSGSTLTIDHLYNYYSDYKDVCDYGINLNGHGYYGCGGPQNTLIGYQLAHMMGYKYCITIPKVTSDGVLVCLHDDDSIQATARNDDGSQIAAEYRDRAVSTFTYSQLLQFDFGICRGLPFKGERIPKLEDFFALCAKTGMHPMLSCHPSLYGYWTEIKALAEKYNLLDKLNIKCDQSNITVMMDVLGGDIESYTIDESGGVDRAERMTTLISRYNIDTTKCRCGVEYIGTITDSLINSALSAGLFVGLANYLTDATKVKEMIAKGVTEFTDDYIASVGLDW